MGSDRNIRGTNMVMVATAMLVVLACVFVSDAAAAGPAERPAERAAATVERPAHPSSYSSPLIKVTERTTESRKGSTSALSRSYSASPAGVIS